MNKYFDRFAGLCFGTVNKVFAELIPASWTSVDNTSSYNGPVLFENPTAKLTLDQVEYVDADPYFEYYEGAFPNLKQLVDAGSTNEVVNISGEQFYVTGVDRLSDGKTYRAHVVSVTV